MGKKCLIPLHAVCEILFFLLLENYCLHLTVIIAVFIVVGWIFNEILLPFNDESTNCAQSCISNV